MTLDSALQTATKIRAKQDTEKLIAKQKESLPVVSAVVKSITDLEFHLTKNLAEFFSLLQRKDFKLTVKNLPDVQKVKVVNPTTVNKVELTNFQPTKYLTAFLKSLGQLMTRTFKVEVQNFPKSHKVEVTNQKEVQKVEIVGSGLHQSPQDERLHQDLGNLSLQFSSISELLAKLGKKEPQKKDDSQKLLLQVIKELQNLKTSMEGFNFPSLMKVDWSGMPVAQTNLPFKGSNGKPIPVSLDSQGKVPVSFDSLDFSPITDNQTNGNQLAKVLEVPPTDVTKFNPLTTLEFNAAGDLIGLLETSGGIDYHYPIQNADMVIDSTQTMGPYSQV